MKYFNGFVRRNGILFSRIKISKILLKIKDADTHINKTRTKASMKAVYQLQRNTIQSPIKSTLR